MHQFFKFILGSKLYMFRTVPLSIIRSFSLYTQQWYVIQVCWQFASRIRMELNQPDAFIPQIYFWNETLHVSDSSSIHHQEFFTVHTTTICHTGLLVVCE